MVLTVSIIETIGGTIAAFGSATPTVTTTLATTDRVVVVISKTGTAGTPSVSGLSGTWVADVTNTVTFDHYIFSTGSVTGSGTVTVSVGSAAGDYMLYVLRSSVSNAVVFVNGAANNIAAATSGTLLSLSAASTSNGSMHLVSGYAGAGTIDIPHSSASPNTGFTSDRTVGSGLKYLSRAAPADESITVVMTANTAYNGSVARANYYDNNVPTPPASGFTGWGVPIF